MEMRQNYCMRLVILFCVMSVSAAIVDKGKDSDREKNEINENIGYTNGDVFHSWSDPLENSITTESPVKRLVAKPTRETIQPSGSPPKSEKNGADIDPIDRYLLDGLLDIVDEKFATLAKRLSTLERGVHSIQYYNVRSFRVINTHLHAVDTMLHGINTQIDQVDKNNKEFSQGLSSVKEEITDFQSLNSGMFQAIEQNLVHFHKDVKSRLDELKGDVDKTNTILNELKNDTAELRSDTDNVKNLQSDILLNTENSMIMTSDVAKGTLFLLNITEHFQQDVTDSLIPTVSKTQHTVQNVNTNVSKLVFETQEIRNALSTFFTNVSSDSSVFEKVFVRGQASDEHNELKVPDSTVNTTCSAILQLVEDRLNKTPLNNQPNSNACRQTFFGGPSFRNHSRKLLRALATVNENLYQSVTLYKHTGNLIERVISDAELIAGDQKRLREDLRVFLFNGSMDIFNETLPDVGEFVRFNQTSGLDVSDKEKQPECQVSKEILNEISKLSFNGTQMLELLTELATTSTSAMQNSINKLESEVERLHQVKEDSPSKHLFNKLENFARDDPKVESTDCMKDLQNRTDWIYQLTEAIASNTGWIPYLFHNVRFIESQVNKILNATKLLSKTVESSSKSQEDKPSIFTPQKYLNSELLKTQANLIEMLSRFNEMIKTGKFEDRGKECDPCKPEVNDLSLLTNNSMELVDMMGNVHETSNKLRRLIPALTNLLGEPEPYVTLLNGSSDREGRVEIYYKGQWGTVATQLSHVEASYICRKLGYVGGLSTGNGLYGPGSGVFWNLNVTCLWTRRCRAVHHATDSSLYHHSNDVGIICDHMIRLEPNDENFGLSGHRGKLEIYHENAWRPVCYDGWDKPETNVVCKQLGYHEGAATAVTDESLFEDRWLTNVTCSESDKRLDLCSNGGFVYGGCTGSSYVSLICS